MVKGNFVLVYELLDEVLDHGYPQVRYRTGGGTGRHTRPACWRVLALEGARRMPHGAPGRACALTSACFHTPLHATPPASPPRIHLSLWQVTDPAVLKSLIFQKGWVTPSTKKKREAEAANATLQVRGRGSVECSAAGSGGPEGWREAAARERACGNPCGCWRRSGVLCCRQAGPPP